MINLFEEYSEKELLVTDIQFLGLKKNSWEFSRGARTERKYLYENNTLAIKDYYEYTMDSQNEKVVSFVRKIEWYDDQGSLIIKKDISPHLNVKSLKALNREIRQGRIDYLEAAAKELSQYAPFVPEPYSTDFIEVSNSIDILFSKYETEINHYITRGTDEFEKIINEEDNPIMLSILSRNTYIPDAIFPIGLTLKKALIYQIKGIIPGV